MKLRLGVALFFAIALIFFSTGVSASTVKKSPVEEKTKVVTSFELFWPIPAGKVAGDRWYGLKLFKENLRGLLIFGEKEKVEYQLFLATKRVVEAEKLALEGKTDKANVTLSKVRELVSKSSLLYQKGLPGDLTEIDNKLARLNDFLPVLKEIGGVDKGLVEEIEKLIKPLLK